MIITFWKEFVHIFKMILKRFSSFSSLGICNIASSSVKHGTCPSSHCSAWEWECICPVLLEGSGFQLFLESCTDTVYDIECIPASLCWSSGPCPTLLYITLLTPGVQHQIFQMLTIHNIAADFQQWEATSCDIYSQAQILKRTWHIAPNLIPAMDVQCFPAGVRAPILGPNPILHRGTSAQMCAAKMKGEGSAFQTWGSALWCSLCHRAAKLRTQLLQNDSYKQEEPINTKRILH